MGDNANAGTEDIAAGKTVLSDDGAAGSETPEQKTAAELKAKSDAEVAARAKAADVELKMPEGYRADEAWLGKWKATAKEHGLDSAKAQKLFDLHVEAQLAADKAADAAAAKEQEGWMATLKADEKLGGDKFDGSVATARKAMQKFASPELRKFLQETGLGDHPELVRFAHAVGKAMAEDSTAGTAGTGGNGKPSRVQQIRDFYDNPTSQAMFKE